MDQTIVPILSSNSSTYNGTTVISNPSPVSAHWQGRRVYICISRSLFCIGALGLTIAGTNAYVSQKEVEIPLWVLTAGMIVVGVVTCVGACALQCFISDRTAAGMELATFEASMTTSLSKAEESAKNSKKISEETTEKLAAASANIATALLVKSDSSSSIAEVEFSETDERKRDVDQKIAAIKARKQVQ